MSKRLMFVVSIVISITILFTACVPTAEGPEPEKPAVEEGGKHKIGILAPAVTHGWVAAVAYHAENRAKELADQVDYKLYTSSNAEEMTTQLDDLLTWARMPSLPSRSGRAWKFQSNARLMAA